MATTDYSLDRGLPASADAERAILGAILLDNTAYSQAAEYLQAEDFSLDSHRRIYLRMMELAESGRAIDFVTLTEQLGQHKEIESVGGTVYVMQPPGTSPAWRAVRDYNSRMVVAVNFNTDVGDAWEFADVPYYPEAMTSLAYRYGINYLIYAMTH